MLRSLLGSIRSRWHPLWRLRQSAVYRKFQENFDFTVYKRIPETNLKVAIRLFRDASWMFVPTVLEPEVRTAFTLVLDLLKPAVFWDIGANIGFYSWFVRNAASINKVVMFEPDPINFALIQRTIRKNKILNCKAINVALCEHNGRATFWVDRVSGAVGSLQRAPQASDGRGMQNEYGIHETITCSVVSIDRLIDDGLTCPDLMKIDVEGVEHLIMQGGKLFFETQRPTIIIETANAALLKQFHALGYTVFRIDSGNFLLAPNLTPSQLDKFRSAFPEQSNT